MNVMRRPTYYCYRCKGNHYYTSKIGRRHRGGLIPGVAPKRAPKKKKPKKKARSKRPPSRPVRQANRVFATPSVSDLERELAPAASPAWSQRRDSARLVVDRVSGTAASAVAVMIFDPESRYQQMADEILARMPWYRGTNRGHWLCRRLEDAGEALSPGTYLERVGSVVAEELRRRGLPRFAAEVIAKSLTTATGRAIGSLGTDQLITTLRALIPLVCPNFERCPTQQSVCSHFLAPGVEQALRSTL